MEYLRWQDEIFNIDKSEGIGVRITRTDLGNFPRSSGKHRTKVIGDAVAAKILWP